MSEENSFIDSLHVSNESIKSPFFMILYGKANCGKTGMCLNAPNPFFVSLESGTDWVPAPKFVNANKKPILPKTIDQFFDMLKFLMQKNNIEKLDRPVKTVVIDSLGFLETLIYAQIITEHPMTEGKNPQVVESIIDLGYDGMGYAIDYWQKLLSAVKRFKQLGLNVILITHSAYFNMTSPSGKSYKEIGMELQIYGKHNVPALLQRACDYCYYMSTEIETVEQGKGSWAKNVALGTHTSKTLITTRPTALFFAKTRTINEKDIPDTYIYDIFDRDEVQQQIFNDILKG